MAKAQKEKNDKNELVTHEFIPYACHFTEDSVLTKNGELVMFLKIADSGGSTDDEFRRDLRAALLKYIDPSKIALWVHTIRTRAEAKQTSGENYFEYIDFLWRDHLPQEIHYRNEIYITLVVDSTPFAPWKMKEYLRSLSRKAEERYRNDKFQEKYELLSKASGSLMKVLEKYSPKKLGIYKYEGSYYSEAMEFVRRLIGFGNESFKLPESDLSVMVKPGNIAFNSYSGNIFLSEGNRKYYGSMITVKECVGLTSAALQDLLNLDSEMIISQSVDMAYSNRFLPAIKEQEYVLSISNDEYFIESAGLKNVEISNPKNLALQQLTIQLFKSDLKTLNESLQKVHARIKDLGLVSFTEDINAERIYWSVLPGNFAYLKRQNTIKKADIATFACFGVDKYSDVDNCIFGKPVIFLETNDEAIFPLHFLGNGKSHILLVGADEEQRQVLGNLITTNAAGMGAKVIFFDQYVNYHEFSARVSGQYLTKLDLDFIASRLTGETTVIIINSLLPILENDGHDAFCEFLQYVGDKNAIVIAMEELENNSELLLEEFNTTVFFPNAQISEQMADNYDIFEDEKRVIENLQPDQLYVRHGHEEHILKFAPNDVLQEALLSGKVL